ncbi:uncharacterized protein [Epargyreus clarus]|uniref:uncharacterized protein isoform X10 n=1 Tax=Epargyreus clarus TaxID=520877 RepID=UPI003C2BFBAE
MRAGVWWSAAALTLLIVVTSALRTPQVDGTSRTSRRLSSSDSRGASSTSKAEEVQPTFRPRNHRRREEPTTARKEESPRDVPRTRSRTRPPEKDITPSPSEQLQTYTSRNERFDSRRTSSRSRSRAVENDVNIETSTVRDNNSRGRTRQSSRRATLPSTPTPIEVSSPQVEEKAEIINNNFEDISKTVPKEENTPINTANQFRRRSSTSRTIVETVTPKKNRGRVNTRGNLRSSDLEVSGTTNTLSALLGKEPTTARSGDLRSSRKLRYRTRPSDTDSNLTGEGLATLNEVIGSSQKKERLTSQSDTVSSSSATVENVVQQITEKIPPKTTKGSKVVRRPLVRGKVNVRPTVALPKKKVSEEIKEDDNYPESFKALIQAKNATQTSSSPSETLSVRASQKVFKTYPQSSQSIHSDPDTDKQSLLRSKPNLEEENEKITVKQENVTETTVAPPKNKSAEYRPRGTYTPRNRKASSFTSSSTSAPLLNTEKPYKFSRKFNKISTTTTPRSENSLKNKRADTTSTVKKPLARSSYYSRKFTVAPNLSTQAPAATNNDTSQNTSVVTPKTRGTLPRTAFYSRLRNKVSKKEITSSVEPSKNLNAEVIAEKKSENTAEMPIILTMFSGTSKDVNLQEDNKNKGNDPFIISVTSTESQENSKDNEVVNRIDETEKKPVINVVSTTQKYHAHYNDKNSENISEQKEKVITGATPPIRNIQTRKYGRKPAKAKDHEEIVFTTPKSREKSLRKYSDTFSKTTEPSTNVITPEPEKPKNRFSSKYRASYLDKPFYKPTVPTVTPSTVEGEEMQLGPDMNAISFTQTGSTLSSADLRLSESLVKPLQVMNVEASHHSPSVTVSIFDALAEILTSTPRPRISTTTEVMQTQNSNNDVKQTLNGVSNNINVNSVNGLPSQDTLSTISINTNTKSVQTTDQTTPNVFNSMSVGESVTPSLNIEEGKTTFVNTPIPFTLPPTTPTTPLSARRPFAIKVLYSDTESPTDKITTASVPLPTQPPTDRPTTTKQIRTEKPSDGSGNTVFKFIPIDEVTVTSQESNVLKLASTKMPQTSTTNEAQTTVTESNTQSPQIQTRLETFNDPTTTTQANAATPFESNTENANTQPTITMLMNDVSTTTDTFTLTTESVASTTTTRVTTLAPTTETTTTTQAPITTTTVPTTTTPAPTTPVATTVPPTTTTVATTTTTSTTTAQTTTTTMPPTTTVQTTIPVIATSTLTMSTTSEVPTTAFLTTTFVPSTTNGANNYQKDAELLQSLLQDVGRNPKNLNLQNSGNQVGQVSDDMKFLQALLSGTGQKVNVLKVPNSGQTTTLRSIEDDIRQFEEDTKLLKALLQATGRNPAELNLPSLDNIKAATTVTITNPTTTTTTPRPTTTTPATTPATTRTTTPSINDDIRKLQEDAKLLQSLLQATGQNPQSFNLPVISGITSNVRISSNPLSTSVESNPTSPLNIRPVYTTLPSPVFTTSTPRTATIATTFQSQPTSTTTEVFGISTTFPPINANIISTTPRNTISPQNIGRTRFTTEIPSTSTFSVEEDLVFLQNLKSVLNTNTKAEDPEAALANRIIALAVERSLNEIQTGAVSSTTTRPTTTVTTTTTMRPTTTRQTTTRPTTTPPTQSTRSIEDDIKQFEEDTKLLQALLKATGQDPSKFNIPTLPTTNRPSTSPSVDRQTASTIAAPTTVKPFGAKIAVKDDLRNVQDDAKLLQTLKQLQDAQDITTQKNKLALTGQSSDEALQKLIQQANPTGMVSEATKSSISLSTEYGNSNDALLAALLKEQGFGPTTASSLDEQLRLSALLNQVVVTPKARRTTTPPPPPPPPAPRRPILDGLAWLWQQWRDTAPGSGEPRPNRRPTSSARPSPSPSPTTSSRVNWFGSGPFVGNADDRPASNRIPLEPPRAVAAEQAPGRGQLVSAAINVTRAFSQFLGAAIQGAAQTVQNVIRAGQRAATDVYSGGSGASG